MFSFENNAKKLLVSLNILIVFMCFFNKDCKALETKIKVSVIVPVYQVEPWIDECMNSLIHQTLKEIEIICIDDGTTDKCGEILDRYAKNDDRIIVIHQENQGVSNARNVGIEIARGEYISFVDPDESIRACEYCCAGFVCPAGYNLPFKSVYIHAERYNSVGD